MQERRRSREQKVGNGKLAKHVLQDNGLESAVASVHVHVHVHVHVCMYGASSQASRVWLA